MMKLTVAARLAQPKQIGRRVASTKATTAPTRRLVIARGAHKAPPGGGWTRTPNGWSRGRGNDYEWQPLTWGEAAS